MGNFKFQKLFLCLLAGLMQTTVAQTDLIIPGGDWRDSNGKLIAATEGGIIKVDSLYYLWGMDRSANNYAFVGINLYSSPDLKNWTFVNQILKKTSHPDLNNDAVVERAKILHNKKTGQFVMWMHFEGHNAYKIAEVGLATCNTIGGNYTFHSHFRPLDIDSRDINVYQDDDGKGYLICTTKGNQNVSLFELDSTYTKVVREIYRGSASDDMECEGHAIIKTGGYYFWLMSWCTGWDFNDNHYFYATKLAGPWNKGGNIATSNTHTYESQVGFAVTVKGSKKTTFLYTGDRWSVNNYSMSRIVLLPIEVNGTKLSVKWYDQYNIDAQTGEWSAGAKYFPDGIYTITAKHSGLVLGTTSSSAASLYRCKFTVMAD
jgi:beta-xylosidase